MGMINRGLDNRQRIDRQPPIEFSDQDLIDLIDKALENAEIIAQDPPKSVRLFICQDSSLAEPRGGLH